MIIIKKILNKIFKVQESELNTIQIIKDILLNYNIFKVRFSRSSLKIFNFNVKKTLNNENQNEKVANCNIDRLNFPNDEDFFHTASEILRNYGTLIVKNCFTKKEIDLFLKDNSNICPKKYYKNNSIQKYMQKNTTELPLGKNKFIFDDRIIKILELSSNLDKKTKKENIYIRQPSTITYFEAKQSNLDNNWTAGWHVDYPTQITTHIILEDLKITDTRMQVIPKSNKLLLIPGKHYKMENDWIKDKLIDCIGEKGTLYIHSGNTLHRNFPVHDTSRYLWCQIYTMDKVFFTIDDHERSQILHDSETYFKNLCPKDKERIDYLINCPKYINKKNNKFFKVVKGKYISASKSELTYL